MKKTVSFGNRFLLHFYVNIRFVNKALLFKGYRDLCSHALGRGQGNLPVVIGNTVAHDGKTKSRAANLLRVALVNSVKTLKNSRLMLTRNTYSRVCYREYG